MSAADPLKHTAKMKDRLKDLITHLRKDIEIVDEPQFRALFETSAEVLGGLVQAMNDYEAKEETAWRNSR